MRVGINVVDEIAEKVSISPDILIREGLRSFLMDRKRELMIERLEMLLRYGVETIDELEQKIRKGETPEHPAWEDLIDLTNLEDELKGIQDDIDRLSEASPHSKG